MFRKIPIQILTLMYFNLSIKVMYMLDLKYLNFKIYNSLHLNTKFLHLNNKFYFMILLI